MPELVVIPCFGVVKCTQSLLVWAMHMANTGLVMTIHHKYGHLFLFVCPKAHSM